jgi:hypothetical protein
MPAFIKLQIIATAEQLLYFSIAMTFRNITFAICGCISSNLDGRRNWLKRTGLDYEARTG